MDRREFGKVGVLAGLGAWFGVRLKAPSAPYANCGLQVNQVQFGGQEWIRDGAYFVPAAFVGAENERVPYVEGILRAHGR